MQTPIERVMQAYGMMVNLTAEQEQRSLSDWSYS